MSNTPGSCPSSGFLDTVVCETLVRAEGERETHREEHGFVASFQASPLSLGSSSTRGKASLGLKPSTSTSIRPRTDEV